MPQPIIIVPYDMSWPRIYEEEKRLILSSVGHLIHSLEHIGSTSVHGLYAKPIVDILAGVDDLGDAEQCRALLLPLGYESVSSGDNPDWYYCLGKNSNTQGFHLHLVREGSQFQRKHTLFRDWLKTHPRDAEAYKDLKITLSKKYRDDRLSYTISKTEFIDRIIEKAKKEAKTLPNS